MGGDLMACAVMKSNTTAIRCHAARGFCHCQPPILLQHLALALTAHHMRPLTFVITALVADLALAAPVAGESTVARKRFAGRSVILPVPVGGVTIKEPSSVH
jgi:hypothetical protein